MFSSGVPQLNFDDLHVLGNSYGGHFDGFNFLDPSNVVGSGQRYLGSGVLGDSNSYPEYPNPPLSQINGPYPNKGYASEFHQGLTMSSIHPPLLPSQVSSYSTLALASPFPIPPRGFPSLSSSPHTAPNTPPLHRRPKSEAIATQEGPDLGFPAVAENFSLPAANHPLTDDSTYGELRPRFLTIDPRSLSLRPSNSIAGAGTPEIHPPQPVASSSGPRRNARQEKEARRYDPLRIAQKKADSDGWDQTLVRFRAHLDSLYDVHNGQPSGRLAPEKAIAKIAKFIKGDLKRSPLHRTKAGEGKRSRNVETYLEGLLQTINKEDPTPDPAGGASSERSTIAELFSALADELEAGLVAINEQPALRQPPFVRPAKKGANGEQNRRGVKRSQTEKERRGCERHSLGRVSRLFRAPTKLWSRRDMLCLGLLFLQYGPAAFPPNFVLARH